MPRNARKHSCLDLYHVILRGINKMVIFEEKQDFQTFYDILKHYQKERQFSLYAYCFMSNHVHILIGNTEGELGKIMQSIEVAFADWYNKKYDRCGHLFQNRFRSEPIDDYAYFLSVWRYIHQNPLHAGIEKKVGEYSWSSYAYYSGARRGNFVNTEFVIAMFQNSAEMLSYLTTDTKMLGMEEEAYNSLSDEDAGEVILKYTSCYNLKEMAKLPPHEIANYMNDLTNAGFSIRKLSRLTGISTHKIASMIRD